MEGRLRMYAAKEGSFQKMKEVAVNDMPADATQLLLADGASPKSLEAL
jgi:hypothetical protein